MRCHEGAGPKSADVLQPHKPFGRMVVACSDSKSCTRVGDSLINCGNLEIYSSTLCRAVSTRRTTSTCTAGQARQVVRKPTCTDRIYAGLLPVLWFLAMFCNPLSSARLCRHLSSAALCAACFARRSAIGLSSSKSSSRELRGRLSCTEL